MIEPMTYVQSNDESNYNEPYDEEKYEENISNINQLSTQLKNSSKKQPYDLKYIKQLKSKDIKLSHKKINAFSLKSSPNPKHGSSFEYERQSVPQQKSPQPKPSQGQQIAKLIKKKKSQNSQKLKQKQKVNEAVSNFNPETMMYSKQNLTLNRDKYAKKIRASELSNLQHRVRQSRSQNKREKINSVNNSNINTVVKNNNKISYENQGNIFQNIDLFAKQNSHHSLDKNQAYYAHERMTGSMNSKIEEKLHLPSLVKDSGLKHVKSKIHQNINLAHQNNETEMEKSHFYQDGVSRTQKSTPYIQKIVKIPIDRLKPLKPQEIKLKYEKKVKQEQKNRAKQRAIQIFEKDELEDQKRRIIEAKKSFELESDENSDVHQSQNRKVESNQLIEVKNKSSLIKQEKFISNRGDNIFKKKLIAYNGQY